MYNITSKAYSCLITGTANESSIYGIQGPRRALSDALACPPPGLGPLQTFDLANFISDPWYAQAMVSSAPPGQDVSMNMLPGLCFLQDAAYATWRVPGRHLMSVMLQCSDGGSQKSCCAAATHLLPAGQHAVLLSHPLQAH